MDDELHPQARAALDRRERFGLSPVHEVGLRRLRLLTWVANWFQNRNPPTVAQCFDRTIPGPDGDLPVRVYRPTGTGPFPTVVFYHGGGYVLGGLDSHDVLCRRLTRESGCVTMAVDYRLAPEHPFPAAVEDAYTALEWAAENRRALAGDGGLAVVGDSAGGALAAVVSLMARDRDGPDIDHQALLYPGVGVEEGQDSLERNDGLVLERGDLAWFRDCYFGSDVHQENPYADPTNACDCSGLPPATVLTAGFDPLRDGGAGYAEQLADDGVPVRHVDYGDMIHGFATEPSIDRAAEATADVAGELRETFRVDRT
jgi:acetyl esterase